MLPDPLHDESYSVALVAKTIAVNDGMVSGYSFWTFSDLFEEVCQFAAPFHGGFGLQTIHGIPKPAYRVFEMLHRLGEQRLPVIGGDSSNVELLVVCGEHGLSLLAYNHNVPDGKIAAEEVVITLKGVKADTTFTMTCIDHDSANPKRKWLNLGSLEYPTTAQLAEIEAASYPISQALMAEQVENQCLLRFTLEPQVIIFITTES